MINKLDFDGLKNYAGGSLALQYEQHMQRALHDCLDRPFEEKPRTVTLTISISPMVDEQTRNCYEVKTECEVASAVPKHRSRLIACKVREDGEKVLAMFNDLAEYDTNQRTVDQQIEANGGNRDGSVPNDGGPVA